MAVWSEVGLTELSPTMRLDPEYYQPHHVEAVARLKAVNAVKVSSFAYVTDGIHASPEWIEDGGVRYLSAKSVKDNYFVIEDAGQISVIQDAANPRTRARLNDVLLTTVGTIGNAAVVYDEIMPANMDRHLGIIRIRSDQIDVDPYYLSLFFNTTYGRAQTLRESTGNVQLNLFIESIKNLLVPISDTLNEYGQAVRQAYGKRAESKQIYAEAESLLLDALGLNDLETTHAISYERNFSEVAKSSRFDAEYFQPKYYDLTEAIENGPYKYQPLGNLIEPIRNGFDSREYFDVGTPYVRVGDVRGGQIDIDSAAKIRLTISDIKKNVRLQQGDVLFTRKGSFGNAAVVHSEQQDAVISSEIMLLRIIDNEIIPDYLALYLNSQAGYLQVERHAHGAAFFSISQYDLARLSVVVPPKPLQENVTHLVNKSRQAAREAQSLLENAKRRVEELIENGE